MLYVIIGLALFLAGTSYSIYDHLKCCPKASVGNVLGETMPLIIFAGVYGVLWPFTVPLTIVGFILWYAFKFLVEFIRKKV